MLRIQDLLLVCAIMTSTLLQGCGGGGDTTTTTATTSSSSSPTTTPATTTPTTTTPTTTTPTTTTPTKGAEYDTTWQALIAGSACEDTKLTTKDGKAGGTIKCARSVTGSPGAPPRLFSFPNGKFDIDVQVVVPAYTQIQGNANPIPNLDDKTQAGDSDEQTFFVATTGVTDAKAAYCGTAGNMKPGDAQKLRIGFLMNSNTLIKWINFQGKDTVRPNDNGNLCGGGVFETPGCVSPGFGDGVGTGWVDKTTGCYDHTGAPNDLITGDGKGVVNVVIDSVRLNQLDLPSDPTQYVGALASQVAVWVAQTQDGSATTEVQVTNLVSMLLHADGINLHGNVQDSLVQDCHIENTGDDIYAMWGGYAKNPSKNVFKNNVAKNPGVTRNYQYGVCVAVYGARDVTITGTTCYDRKEADWNPGQVPKGNWDCQNGAYCNSCLAYVHDGWFGAVYPDGNAITLTNNKYYYMDSGKEITTSERPLIRHDSGTKANIVTSSVAFALV